ncbi:MAG: efflux RND transporter periplasmic adaptor subunit [Acetobacteraceae bacterium]|nr:efflux RND transporter periplasmic adaptor subunit [Acetobacteraceae bacterium]
MTRRLRVLIGFALLLLLPVAAIAQPGPGAGPPAVGVVHVEKKSITETSEFIGRVQATDRVDLTARVTAFIDERLFTEGAEVQQGDLLYHLERAPFEAAVQQQGAAVAQANAQLNNANITLGRAQALLNTPAGQRSTVDDARAAQLSQAAQVMSTQAQLRQAQINLDYTEIHAPIAGKISQTRLTIGNVVSPSAGPLATIVSQDPMYVVFPVSVRAVEEEEKRYRDKGGVNAITVKLRLSDGTMYDQTGKIDYIDPTVATNTDTILLRAVIPNPRLHQPRQGEVVSRALIDGQFVTVLVESTQPVQALAIPRSAVLSDQQGNYVWTVDADNKAQQARIQLGQSTADTAIVMSGLTEGQLVVVDGIQRVKPGAPVSPGPASPGPGVPQSATAAPAGGSTPAADASSRPAAVAAGESPSGGPAAVAATSPATATPASGAPAGSAGGGGGGAGTSAGH